jgi:hypothetical protein
LWIWGHRLGQQNKTGILTHGANTNAAKLFKQQAVSLSHQTDSLFMKCGHTLFDLAAHVVAVKFIRIVDRLRTLLPTLMYGAIDSDCAGISLGIY